MNEMNTKVEICSAPAPGTASIKSLMSDVADLANTAYVRADLTDPMASSLREALETHREVLAALCNSLDALIQGLGV